MMAETVADFLIERLMKWGVSRLYGYPDDGINGITTALRRGGHGFTLERLKDVGMKVAMVETGGDPVHAPARRVYEKAGYTLLPIARYFKNL